MSLSNVFLAILLIAALTFLTRVFPFFFFSKTAPPDLVTFVGKYIPPAIITILVIYCLKDIDFAKAPYGLNEVLAIAVLVVLHLWKGNSLISIFGATLGYMYLLQSAVLSHM